MKKNCYDNYPFWIVLVSNLFSALIYIAGAIIIYQLGLIWLIFYLLFLVMLEIKVMKNGCINCYYYGKYCAFGRGKVACLLFKKGNKKFDERRINWKDVIPDFMVSLIPVAVGVILLFIKFSLLILVLIILLVILTFAGNAFVRGKLACKYCKQRELGCPAEKLFNKEKK